MTAAENWLSTGANFATAGFFAYDRNATPHVLPIGHLAGLPDVKDRSGLTMSWRDTVEDVDTANSISLVNPLTGVRNPAQRYFIELMSTNNRLQSSSQVVGGRSISGCNQVNTYLITGRGVSARGAVKYVQSYYSVLSCPS